MSDTHDTTPAEARELANRIENYNQFLGPEFHGGNNYSAAMRSLADQVERLEFKLEQRETRIHLQTADDYQALVQSRDEITRLRAEVGLFEKETAALRNYQGGMEAQVERLEGEKDKYWTTPPAEMSSAIGMLTIDSTGMRKAVDEITRLRAAREEK